MQSLQEVFADDGVLAGYPVLESLLALALILLLAFVANWIAKRVVLKLIWRMVGLSPFAYERDAIGNIGRRLSNILPALIIQFGIGFVPHLPATAVTLTRNLSSAFIILTVALAISRILTLINDVYQRNPASLSRPIKGYIQVGKIILFIACAVLIIAALMDRSPFLLLSGIGALAAVLMLVFKDTLLSLVASVQIASNDMVRVGDWIEMPQLNADGDVIDIALHVVKVRNWDKTITTIPTQRLITDSFKNWRGMSESGVRRIMRAMMIDQTTIRFLEEEETEKLKRFALISDYIDRKGAELAEWNHSQAADHDGYAGNARRMTNIGTFRAYVLAYLQGRSDIADDQTLIVRQLAPTGAGLPLQIYCFTTTTSWVEYEGIQSDIFDHLLSILPEFDLLLFQEPTGRDLAKWNPSPPKTETVRPPEHTN